MFEGTMRVGVGDDNQNGPNQLVLKGPVWSRFWALYQTVQGPVQSQKFPEPKTTDQERKKLVQTSLWWSWTKMY